MKRTAWSVLWVLITIVFTFFVIRVLTDAENIMNDRDVADSQFEARYAEHPVLAYLHIVPGVIFLLGALHQLSASMRRKSLKRHRRLGRVLAVNGLISGAFAVVFGVLHPYGGTAEASAALVFGLYLVVALVFGVLAARQRDMLAHRRWMIRAVAVGAGVGTIRLIIGFSEATGIATFDEVFGTSFWIGLLAHAAAAELWLRLRPTPQS